MKVLNVLTKKRLVIGSVVGVLLISAVSMGINKHYSEQSSLPVSSKPSAQPTTIADNNLQQTKANASTSASAATGVAPHNASTSKTDTKSANQPTAAVTSNTTSSSATNQSVAKTSSTNTAQPIIATATKLSGNIDRIEKPNFRLAWTANGAVEEGYIVSWSIPHCDARFATEACGGEQRFYTKATTMSIGMQETFPGITTYINRWGNQQLDYSVYTMKNGQATSVGFGNYRDAYLCPWGGTTDIRLDGCGFSQ